MGRENTVKTMYRHVFTQFDLSKKILNNLSQFNLKPTTKLVLLYLCDCYNPKHGEMFPKQSTIAEKLGISEVSVTRAIQELHKEGLLISERKYINRYRFTSRIVSDCPANLIDDNNQKDMKESIKKIPPCNRTNKQEQKKEQTSFVWGNVYSIEEYSILKEYALKRTSEQQVDVYIAGIRNKGGDKAILKKYRSERFIIQRAKTTQKETQQLIAEQQELSKTAVLPSVSEAWKNFGEKIKAQGYQ